MPRIKQRDAHPTEEDFLFLAQDMKLLERGMMRYPALLQHVQGLGFSRAQLLGLMTKDQRLYHSSSLSQGITAALGSVVGVLAVAAATFPFGIDPPAWVAVASGALFCMTGWQLTRTPLQTLHREVACNLYRAVLGQMPQPSLESLVADDELKRQCWDTYSFLERELVRRKEKAAADARKALPKAVAVEEKLQLAFQGCLSHESLDNRATSGGEV